MRKNSEKLLFLVVIVAAALVTRFLYPTISDSPTGVNSATLANADSNNATSSIDSNTSIDASSTDASITSSNAIAASSTADPATPYYGEASTTGSVFTRTASTAVPVFTNAAYMVADITNGTVLAQNNEMLRWPTASITKLLTATIILDHLNMTTQVTITPQMFAVDPTESTLVVNDTYTVQDLLHVMVMPSSNVAAESMADFYGHDAFMKEMNVRAQQWGMTSSYFDDPSGLSSANQSSPHDMFILAQHVYENYPTIFQFTNTPEIMITELNTNQKVEVRSINNFAGTANFIGGKTGHTNEAGENLLSLFNYNGHPVFIVVLGADSVSDRFADTTKLLNWFKLNYR